ncbi:MAG: hypothetical protein C0434_01915 [Xanthomonadaceae bacterium]|nr:hypothetical protein [Xanthomonadaceae bacterium]
MTPADPRLGRHFSRCVLGIALLLNSCVLLSQPDAPRLAQPALDELSGLAVSKADPTVLWGHNDSGGRAELFRIGVDGSDLGRLRVSGARAYDWEDISAFEWRGKPALLIADVGDNKAARHSVTLYAVSDPGRGGRQARLLWQLDFRYDGGPRDCEAVTVDQADHSVLLLTKREHPKRLYRLPLPKGKPPVGVATAELLGEVTTVPQPSALDHLGNPMQAHFFGQPTAMDLSPDGRSLLVLTYKNALRWRRRDGQPWIEALAAAPEIIALPFLRQAEALAVAADGQSMFVSSEGASAPLLRVPLSP